LGLISEIVPEKKIDSDNSKIFILIAALMSVILILGLAIIILLWKINKYQILAL